MPRVTAGEVRAVTGEPATVDPAAAIATATFWVDKLLAVGPPIKISDSVQLTQIELYLAAHFLYLTVREGPMAAEAFGDASERYHNIYEQGLGASRFGQQAMMFDTTGTLTNWSKNATAKGPLKAQLSVIGDSTDVTEYGL
jgi:hypothetical protein